MVYLSKWKLIIVFFMINYILIIQTGDKYINNLVYNTSEEHSNSFYMQDLSTIDPIIIVEDQDFLLYSFPGTGTEEDPYLIQNYLIDTTIEFGIFITNTTKYFKIQNCSINAGVSAISLSNLTTENIEISNNVCHGEEWYGIYIYSTDYVTIYNNTCRGGAAGIVCWYSSYESIIENYCHESDFGIALSQTHRSKIEDNYCYDNSIAGIHLLGSNKVNASRNIVQDSQWGISHIGSGYGIISENYCWNTYNGMYVQDSTRVDVNNNHFTEGYQGIRLEYTTELSIIENTCDFFSSGIYILHDSGSTISNNSVHDNSYTGINIRNSESTLVTNNSVFRNEDYGIVGYRGSPVIFHNLCYENGVGIRIKDVESVTISNNTCQANQHGILLEETDFSTVSYNILQDNFDYGIYIHDYSTWNKIHHNWFICNNLNGTKHGFSQAFDEGFNNRWYDSSTDFGNYWTDYQGEGEYQIDGERNKTDPYPIAYNYCCETDETNNSLIIGFFILIILYASVAVVSRRERKINQSKTQHTT